MASYSLEQRRREEEERQESAPEPEPEPAEARSLADRTLELQASHGNAAVARMVAGSPEAKAMLQREAAAAEVPGNTSGQDFEQRMLHEDVAQIVEYLRMQILDAPWEQRIVDIIKNWRENDRLHGAAGTPMLDHGLFLLKTTVFTRRTVRTLWIETYVNAYDTLWAELEDDRLVQFKAVIEGSKHATAGPESENENYAKDLAKQEGMGFFAAAMAMGKGLAGIGDLVVRTGSELVGHEINPKWAKAIEESGREAGYDLFGTAYLTPDELTKRGYSQEDAERLAGEKLLFGMNASDIGTTGGTFIWKLVEMAKGPIKEIKTALKLPGLLLKIEDGFREIGERFEALEKAGEKAGKEVELGTVIRDAKIRNAAFEISGAAVELALELMGDSGGGKEAADTVGKAVLTGAQQAKRIKLILETGDKLARIVGIVTDPEKKPDDKDKELFELFMDVFTDAFKEFNEGLEKGLGAE
jgi:hypothetical protein